MRTEGGGCWYGVVLFVSSRGRHTRWPRDWSSDVCSSDLTRKRPARDESGRGDAYASLRTSSLKEVDAAETRYREGEADLRNLHLDLNHILREFASGRLRMDASSLTVGELATLEGTDRLTDLLADYQEPAFAADSDAQALAATQHARAVISQW